MPESKAAHQVFIVNEEEQDPFVHPKVLHVGRGDRVRFVVVGEKDQFNVRPGTNVFRSIVEGEDIPAELGSPPSVTVRSDVEVNSIHRYEVLSATQAGIDPILIIYE